MSRADSIIVGVEKRPLADLRPYPQNPNNGDTDAITESMAQNGIFDGLVVDVRNNQILSGNHRYSALLADGQTEALCIFVQPRDDKHAAKINLAANQTAHRSKWDDGLLAELLSSLDGDIAGTGFDDDYLAELLSRVDGPKQGLTDPDDVPAPPKEAFTKQGDLWLLGPHRLACGDSTDPHAVARLFGSVAPATLILADPPYGMGKEAEGVLNDNLYGAKLDAFQMRWIRAWAEHWTANGSVYVWGNAPDLWRLWWVGGLSAFDDLAVRNELVWDKGSGFGMRSGWAHSYPPATERCLFLMRGQQFLGNQNKDDYWEGFEPLRSWLASEVDRAGWSRRDVDALTGTQMSGHWLSRSQFQPIDAKNYRKLAAAAAGRAFTRNYDDLFDELFPDVKDGGNPHRRELSAALRANRTFFDNAHEAMTDVWQFPRVHGEERFGHATPKPVAMISRAMRSSSQPGDVVAVPFGGSGPDFIAAHSLDRIAVGMELEPAFVDVICKRFEEFTGMTPVLEATGESHSFLERVGADE